MDILAFRIYHYTYLNLKKGLFMNDFAHSNFYLQRGVGKTKIFLRTTQEIISTTKYCLIPTKTKLTLVCCKQQRYIMNLTLSLFTISVQHFLRGIQTRVKFVYVLATKCSTLKKTEIPGVFSLVERDLSMTGCFLSSPCGVESTSVDPGLDKYILLN